MKKIIFVLALLAPLASLYASEYGALPVVKKPALITIIDLEGKKHTFDISTMRTTPLFHWGDTVTMGYDDARGHHRVTGKIIQISYK